MKTSINRIYLWLALILCTAGVAGCDVAEDMSDCYETLSVTFKFTKDGQDRFGTDVSSIALFVFDHGGVFVGQWNENDQSKLVNGYTMTLPLPEGTYNLVAWGGIKGEEYTVYNTGTASPELTVGQTNLNDLLVRLLATDNVVSTIPTDQFYGSQFNVALVKGGGTTIIDLTKNTNQLKLTILGLPSSTTRAADRFALGFTSPNGSSNFHNAMHTQASTYQYAMQNQHSPQAGDLRADIHTMRMVFGNGHRFSIWDNDANRQFYAADLLEDYIRKLPEFSTQAGVDANDVYEITIQFDYDEDSAELGVAVTVNGWVVENPGSEIQ